MQRPLKGAFNARVAGRARDLLPALQDAWERVLAGEEAVDPELAKAFPHL